jgi:hypothetical protein
MLIIYYVSKIRDLVAILNKSSWFLIFLYKTMLKAVPVSISLKLLDFRI